MDDSDKKDKPPAEESQHAGQPADRPHKAPAKKELERMVGELKDQVAGLTAQLEQQGESLVHTTDRMLRALAEAQNTRRRAIEERTRALALQKDEVLASLLPVLDNLVLAAENAGADEASLHEGVRLILRQAQDVLRSHGARSFGARGEPFDPGRHEAVERVADAEVAPGAVAEVLSVGFEREGRMLRPARVRVAVEVPREGGGEGADSGRPEA